MSRNRASVWLSPRARWAHVAIAVWVPGCGVAAWWQVTVALSGDSLGWLYSVEWPVFAIFGIVAWWNLIHDDPEKVGARALRRVIENEPAPATPERLDDGAAGDEELAEYNAYLAALAESGREKIWRWR